MCRLFYPITNATGNWVRRLWSNSGTAKFSAAYHVPDVLCTIHRKLERLKTNVTKEKVLHMQDFYHGGR
jgi:hypothetical protein